MLLSRGDIEFAEFKVLIESLPEEPEIVEHNYFEELMEAKRLQEQAEGRPEQEVNRSEGQPASVRGSQLHQSFVQQSLSASNLHRQSGLRSQLADVQVRNSSNGSQQLRAQSLARSVVRNDLEQSRHSQQSPGLRSRSNISNRPREENLMRSPDLPPSFLAVSRPMNNALSNGNARGSNNISGGLNRPALNDSFNSIDHRNRSISEHQSRNHDRSEHSNQGRSALRLADYYQQSIHRSSDHSQSLSSRVSASNKNPAQHPLLAPPLPPDDSSSDEIDEDLPSNFAKVEGLQIDYRSAGYQDYLDYVSTITEERRQLRLSLVEVKDRLKTLEIDNSRTLSRLQDELTSMSFTVDG